MAYQRLASLFLDQLSTNHRVESNQILERVYHLTSIKVIELRTSNVLANFSLRLVRQFVSPAFRGNAQPRVFIRAEDPIGLTRSRSCLHLCLQSAAVLLELIILASIFEYVDVLHHDVENDQAACRWGKVRPRFHILILTECNLRILRVMQALQKEPANDHANFLAVCVRKPIAHCLCQVLWTARFELAFDDALNKLFNGCLAAGSGVRIEVHAPIFLLVEKPTKCMKDHLINERAFFTYSKMSWLCTSSTFS